MLRRVRAFAPATSANVSAGFDVFGFALQSPGDEVEVELIDGSGPSVRVDAVEGDGGKLPRDGRNTAAVAAAALLEAWERKTGQRLRLALRLSKGLPLGSGMGSSAASAAAAAVAANRLLGEPFGSLDLVRFAMEGERAACGTAHADNAAPAVMGGFALIRSYDPLDVLPLPVPDGLWATIVHPDLVLPTEKSRAVLPGSYPRATVVEQVGNAAAFVAGLCSGDFGLIGRSLVDRLAEPYRAALIPGFAEAKAAALAADPGVLGAGISGSGPSTFALCRGEEAARAAAAAMRSAFAGRGVSAETWTCPVAAGGPRIILEE